MWTALAIAIFVGIGAVAGMVAAFIALMGELDLEMHLGRKEKEDEQKEDEREQRELANR